MRLGIALLLCTLLGALAMTVARYFGSSHAVSALIFFPLVVMSIAGCIAALCLLRKGWDMDRFTRQFILLVFFVYLGLIFYTFAQHFAGKGPHQASAVTALIGMVSFQGATLLLMPRFLKEHNTTAAAGFGLSIGPGMAVLYGVLVALSFLPFAWMLKSLSEYAMKRWGIEPAAQAAVEVLQASDTFAEQLTMGLLAVFIAPIGEELLFRGILYPTIKRMGYRQLALWTNVLLFAAIHANLPIILPLIVLALALTWLYEKTGNLLAPIAAHATFNGLQFALFFLLPIAANKFEWLRPFVNAP